MDQVLQAHPTLHAQKSLWQMRMLSTVFNLSIRNRISVSNHKSKRQIISFRSAAVAATTQRLMRRKLVPLQSHLHFQVLCFRIRTQFTHVNEFVRRSKNSLQFSFVHNILDKYKAAKALDSHLFAQFAYLGFSLCDVDHVPRLLPSLSLRKQVTVT